MTVRMTWALPVAVIAALLAMRRVGTDEPRTAAAPPGTDGSRAAASIHVVDPSYGAPQDVLDFEVYRERVEPIFLVDRGGNGPGEAACATCHVQSGTPMRLQPLQEDGNGGVFWTEQQSRMNFAVVSRLVTPGDPQMSRLLREPLVTSAGGSRMHVGGKFWDSQDDPEWQAMAEWVRSAAAPAATAEAPPTPDFQFFQTCIQRIFLDREEEEHRMECTACHGSGPRGFARTIPEGREFWTEEESLANYGILMELVEPGDPLGSRFLTHPLSPEAGGDNYHSGGRRWHSQDDPEWQMLASWVRGETPATCAVEDR